MTLIELARLGARLRRKEINEELNEIREVLRGNKEGLHKHVKMSAATRKKISKAQLKSMIANAAKARATKAKKNGWK